MKKYIDYIIKNRLLLLVVVVLLINAIVVKYIDQLTKNFLSKLAIPKANPSIILNGLPIDIE